MTESKASEAYKLLAEGKKFLILGDAQNAASRLQQATEQLDLLYGSGAKECGEAYLYYGKSLLQEARIEIGMFGSSVPGVKDQNDVEESESEEGDQNERSGDDGDTGGMTHAEEKTEETVTTLEKNECEDISTPDTGETGDATQTEETNADQAGSSKMEETNLNSSNQDHIETLELAWEVLEAARIIFSHQSGQEAKLNEAEAHLRLAEVGQEAGQFEQAVADIQQCLAIQTSILEPDDRQLAETYYFLAVALGQANRFDDGVREFEQASRILKMRVENIREKLQTASKSTAEPDAETEKERKEMNDLEAILPGIQERIDDFKESKRAIKELAAEALGLSGVLTGNSSSTSESNQQSETGASATTSVSTSKPANDISHLVKRKRKAPVEDSEAKRSRSED